MKKQIRTIWSVASIKMKILFFISSILICAITLIYFSIYQSSVYVNNYNELMDVYYNANSFINRFEQCNKILAQYVKYKKAEDKTMYEQHKLSLDAQVNQFSTDIRTVGKEEYLLARAIKNSYESYTSQVDTMLNETDNSAVYRKYYNDIVPTSGYIVMYSKDLLSQSLNRGQILYNTTKKRLDSIKIITITLTILFLGFSIIFGIALIKHIVYPIIGLSKASHEISEEKFDGCDMVAPNNDEIYELIKAFNKMKHSMYNALFALKEKNEMEKKLYAQKLNAINAQKHLEQAKMSQLQSQVNPHFLFNTLNTISRMARIEGAKETEILITNLSKLFRYTLQTDNIKVPLERELAVIEEYMYIQKVRYGKRVNIDIIIGNTIDINTILIPSFTLQPIVENSIIHGIEPKVEGGTIRIRIHKYKSKLIISIIDNGVGMDQDTLNNILNKKSNKGHLSGIGLSNVRARLSLLYKEYKFVIKSKKGYGTLFVIKIPLEGHENV